MNAGRRHESAIIQRMFGDDESFDETIRSMARELGQSVEHMVDQVDVDAIAGAMGVDPENAREWVDSAGSWLRAQAERLGDEVASRAAGAGAPGEQGSGDEPTGAAGTDRPGRATPEGPGTQGKTPDDDPLRGAAPDPLDFPTREQGVALAALESGRWTVEPGSNRLASHGEGPAPSDTLGLVRELHARDWIASDGEVTLVGRHALSRWLESTNQ
jgi:hypothetical protein